MKTFLQIIGILVVIVGVILGQIWDFSEDWLIEVIGASVVIATLLVNKAKEKSPWKVYLIGGLVTIGTIAAVIGGMTESTIVTVVGAVVAVAAVVVPLIISKVSSSDST